MSRTRIVAVLVCSSVLPMLKAQTGPAATAERAAGTVTSTRDGHGVPHALVTLSPVVTGTAREPASSTLTDNEGHFRFDAVPAGKYHLQASATGYTPSAYQEHGTFSTALVLGRGFSVDHLDLKLTPTALLHGHIVDSNGDPAQRAQISVYRERTPTDQAGTMERLLRVRDVQTDDDGLWEIGDLQPGRFYIAVTGTPWYAVHPRPESSNNYQSFRQNIDPALDVAYPTTFYPHAPSEREATPIELHGGDQVAANLTLQTVHAVSITLQVSSPEPTPPLFPPQLVHSVFGEVHFSGAAVERDNDGWHLTGIAPGEYILQQMRQRTTMQPSGQQITVGASPLTLTLRADPDNVKLTVRPHLLSGGAVPANLQINLRAVGSEGVLSQAVNEKSEKPTAEFTGVPVGEYRVEAFSPNARPLHIASLTVAGQPAADGRLHLTTGGEVAVDLTLQTGSRILNGVASRDGKPTGGAMVVLVPAGADTASALFRRDQSDMDGTFTLSNVVPGNYLLLALEDAWQMRWTDLPTLTPYLNRAIPVSVDGTGSGKVDIPEKIPIQPR